MAYISLAFTLVELALVFKNDSFSEEKEWRIIHTPLNELTSGSPEVIPGLSNLNFRVKNNQLTSYYELDLKNRFNSDLIPEIVLGPKTQLDENVLKDFLSQNNLPKTKLAFSSSSYR